MRQIRLTQGKVALVDDADYEALSLHKWYAAQFGPKKTWYAVRGRKVSEGRDGLVFMHRAILGLVDPRVMGDHRNHDGLDNQRHNLRACGPQANQANRRKGGGSSRFKGVSWIRRDHRWKAQICVDGVIRHLGNFLHEGDAARAYDDAAFEAWGEFAALNRHSFSIPAGRAA